MGLRLPEAADQGLVLLFFRRHRSILLADHLRFSNRSTPCMMPRGGVRDIGWTHSGKRCSFERPGAHLLFLLTSWGRRVFDSSRGQAEEVGARFSKTFHY